MRRSRISALVVVTVAGYGGTTWLLAWASAGIAARVGAPGPAPTDTVGAVVGAGAAAAAWLVLAWLGLTGLLAVAVTAVAGTRPWLERLAERVTPVLVLRAVAAVLGAGLAGGPLVGLSPAYAETAPRPPAAAPATTTADAAPVVAELDRPAPVLPGWTPDRPARRPPSRVPAPVHLVTTSPLAGRTVVDEVVVRRGDTLWDIAARHLGPDADAAEVAAEWPRWHRANREVIGPEPDLIRPGQRLRPPGR